MVDKNKDTKKKRNKYKYNEVVKNKIFLEEFIPHYNALYSHALRLTKDVDEAKDLLQDTFANVFEKIYQYKKGTNAKAFLSRAMYNHFINLTKKKRYTTEIEFIPASKQLISERGLDGLGDEYLELLSAIVPINYDAFVLAVLQDLTYEEISDLLQEPIGTIRTRIHRARQSIIEYQKNKTDKEDGNLI